MEEKCSKEIWVDNLDRKTDLINEKIEMVPAKIEAFTNKSIESFHKITKNIINVIDHSGSFIADRHYDFVVGYKSFIMEFYPAARYTAIPWNYIWLYLWKKYKYGEGNLLLARGIHYVTALQGGGKSTLMYDVAEELRHITGKGSYINAEIEKPRLDESTGMMIKYHKLFDLLEFFGSYFDEEKEKWVTQQKKRFNTEHFNNLILEEWLSEMNHRSNNTSEYKAKFIPLMSSLARMRHQRIMRVYITSQLDTADIQLMGLFKFIHVIEVDLDIDYWQWVEDGKFAEHVKGWNIYTYQYRRNKKKTATEMQLIKKWYRKRFQDFEYFETLNQASSFYSLPKDQIKTTKGVI